MIWRSPAKIQAVWSKKNNKKIGLILDGYALSPPIPRCISRPVLVSASENLTNYWDNPVMDCTQHPNQRAER